MITDVHYFVDTQDFDEALVCNTLKGDIYFLTIIVKERLYEVRKLFPYWPELWKEIGLCWRDKMHSRRALKCLRIAKKV